MRAPHALKGQKLLAQGNTLGIYKRKPVALKGQKLSHLREKVFLKKKSQSLIFCWKYWLKDLIDNKIKRMRLLGSDAGKSHSCIIEVVSGSAFIPL